MRYTIEHASDLGGVIRAARKVQNLRQDDAAGSVGVSESFMVKAERGADTVQWGKVFQILQGLGVRVVVDIPDANDELLRNQSARASHRASVRERRAAERLLLRADAASPAASPPDSTDAARLLKAARLLVADAETAADSAASQPPVPSAASRALDIARRVLADAHAHAPRPPRGNPAEPGDGQ
ncbi:helix-turn-helix domain-containing protein [Burkholderia ubonensis]|uniref:helix-turn-helix domain-containing protein n=1 Tax=Burkholderia ubonensis TaxID=101571 RepID=UPI000751DE3A|nr:helix-turn-helix domain-containing protein [Burkholderia ubonensis]AOI68682.1 XRE family transcriptional regulator [Burkholderia ubonensis]KUZ14907.1 XRE family transcriptional regulator [Burkholderia ubonensis]KUZ21674.1 XRE family transcriptional regulator [Burkholderia ubonensis]KUZ24582.1 XRE family transcriptional regulator [Burkholderia ubonensis]KUZ53240.1 XRE family transcriptional regulator [Burkholderia ubonensis]